MPDTLTPYFRPRPDPDEGWPKYLRDGRAYGPEVRRKRYGEYLQSLAWRCKRADVLARDHYRCTLCRRTEAQAGAPLQAHHLTYARLGAEPLHDLKTVCQSCHNDLHVSPGKATPKQLAKRRRIKDAPPPPAPKPHTLTEAQVRTHRTRVIDRLTLAPVEQPAPPKAPRVTLKVTMPDTRRPIDLSAVSFMTDTQADTLSDALAKCDSAEERANVLARYANAPRFYVHLPDGSIAGRASYHRVYTHAVAVQRHTRTWHPLACFESFEDAQTDYRRAAKDRSHSAVAIVPVTATPQRPVTPHAPNGPNMAH